MSDTEILERQVIESGDPQAIGQLLQKYHDRLQRVVSFRLDPRLRSRVDAEDVLQDAYVEATQRIEDFKSAASRDEISFFLWLRFITLQKLAQLYRHHIGVKARDARRDSPLNFRASPQASSIELAARLLGNITSPSGAAMREENRLRIEDALNKMDQVDREVLALRHFEQLSNSETAQLLQLSPAAASNRYFRAIKRLKVTMDRMGNESGIYFSN